MPQKNDWSIRFGAIRRAKDRAYLAEAEAAIALEEREKAQTAKIAKSPPAGFPDDPDPIDFTDNELARIARAFGRPVR